MSIGTTLQPLHGKVTQRFISRKLDVSVSTVSRALNNNPLVNEETRKKILEIANQFNYSPNEVALSLKNRKTKRVGVAFRNDYPQVQLMSIVNIILANDHWPVLASIEQVSELVRNGLDGIILLGRLDLEHPLNIPYLQLEEPDEIGMQASFPAFFDLMKELDN
ncbi:MAG: LacI family DNA-binding transcriptional regulator [Cytophagales bacterium]|nr:LacI family DNA-binding transcriptional regulator [Cytophagales bacterium]